MKGLISNLKKTFAFMMAAGCVFAATGCSSMSSIDVKPSENDVTEDTVYNYYAEYYEILTGLKEELGGLEFKDNVNEEAGDDYSVFSGLIYANLIDFDNDGKEELITLTNDNPDYPDIMVKLWSVVDGKVKLISDNGGYKGGIGYYTCEQNPSFRIDKDNDTGKYYIYVKAGTGFSNGSSEIYYSVVDGNFDVIYSMNAVRLVEGYDENGELIYGDYVHCLNNDMATIEETKLILDGMETVESYNLFIDYVSSADLNAVTNATFEKLENLL